ncbi:hypothetical protein Bhyg_07895, partial [Pseudolycoriella hygida]
ICSRYWHYKCVQVGDDVVSKILKSSDAWLCYDCQLLKEKDSSKTLRQQGKAKSAPQMDELTNMTETITQLSSDLDKLKGTQNQFTEILSSLESHLSTLSSMNKRIDEQDDKINKLELQNVNVLKSIARLDEQDVSQIVLKDYNVVFNKFGCKIFDVNKQIHLTGRHVNNAFILDSVNLKCNYAANETSFELWHRRMAHLNHTDLLKLKNGLASGISFTKDTRQQTPCVPCLQGKQSLNST